MSVDYEFEVEQDPGGYTPRPDLFARNLTMFPITFNLGRIRWQLNPKGDVDSEMALPWTVAKSSGFERVWNSGQVAVSLDPEFIYIIETLPVGNSLFKPFVWTQSVPQATTTIVHNLSRPGPVKLALYSLDYQTEYFNFTTEMLDDNTCRVSLDDPTTFIATVF